MTISFPITIIDASRTHKPQTIEAAMRVIDALESFGVRTERIDADSIIDRTGRLLVGSAAAICIIDRIEPDGIGPNADALRELIEGIRARGMRLPLYLFGDQLTARHCLLYTSPSPRDS